MEEAQDEAALRDRLAQWGLERLQKEGYCLTGMGAYWLEANQFGRPVAAFSIGPGIVLPENKFESVVITHLHLRAYTDPKQDRYAGAHLAARPADGVDTHRLGALALAYAAACLLPEPLPA